MPSLNISGFKKVNESISADKLSADQLVSLVNLRLDEPVGAAVARKGFSKYKEEVDTTGNIHSLFDVVDDSGNNYLLAGIKTKLRKYLSGVWSDVKTGLTQDAKLRMAPYGGKFIFTNGADEPFYSDMAIENGINLTFPITNGVSLATSLDTRGLSIGWYRYVFVYLTADGQRSNPSNWFETSLNALKNAVTITGIPTPTDSRFVSIEVYRTMVNGFTQFFLLTTLNASATTLYDNVPDDGLNSNYTTQYMTPINSAKCISVSGDRITLGNFNKTYTNRVLPPAFISDTRFVESTSGTLLINAGTYYWAVSYIDSTDNESALITIGSHILATTKNITIIGFPFPLIAYDSVGLNPTFDPNIRSIRFYRTKANPVLPFGDTWPSDSQYYWVGDLAVNSVNWTGNFTDENPDSSLTVHYPRTAIHVPTETISLKSSLVFSNLYHFLEYPELNYIEVYPDDSDEINVIAEGNNCVWIWKTNSICRIENTGAIENWYAQKVHQNIGCDQPNSFVKYLDAYFFVYKNKPYIFDGGIPKLLGSDGAGGFNFVNTFNSITTINGATFWDKAKWYVLAVTIGTDYFLLCYDTKLDGWYKFSISKADSALQKIAGSDAGKLLLGGNLYITLYDETADSDTDPGTTADISVSLTTKNYNFLDDFAISRLFMFYANYLRKSTSLSGKITFTISDSINGQTKIYTDSDNSVTEVVYRIPTDKMTGQLQRGKKLNFTISGEALDKFYGMKLDYNTETWGVQSR